MQEICLEHPAEAALERYLLNQATGEEFEEVETHLFICVHCMDRAEELREFRVALRDGLALLRKQKALKKEGERSSPWTRVESGARMLAEWFAGIRYQRWSFGPALAPVLAALVIAVFLLPKAHEPSGSAFEVTLTAVRGDESGPMIPAGRKVDFHLNVDGLSTGTLACQIVDADGRPVGPLQTVVSAAQPAVQLPPFAAGAYFLRLYATKDGRADQNVLLREFAFQVN